MSNSESDMDLNSEKSGCTYKSRSSRSGTSKSVTPVSDCQKFEKDYGENSKRETSVRELQILPPCTDADCPDHSSPAQAESDEIRLVKNSQATDLKKCKKNSKKNKVQKRKECKDNQDDFVFPKKTVRPNSPIKTPEPVIIKNNLDNLEQDVMPSLNPENEIVVPKFKLISPFLLKLKLNNREQLKVPNENYPDLTSKTLGDFLRLFTNTDEEYRSVMHFLEENKDFDFYVIPPKEVKAIKVVIKVFSSYTKFSDIQSDLEDLGYSVTSCNQSISKNK
ncbi:hypothetical protein TNCV_2326861 [Trichonephila clavipes]|nr:hypothetical protein TNCV_2326861 [Trichonephila clavipes]